LREEIEKRERSKKEFEKRKKDEKYNRIDVLFGIRIFHLLILKIKNLVTKLLHFFISSLYLPQPWLMVKFHSFFAFFSNNINYTLFNSFPLSCSSFFRFQEQN
jgi:hypothetical protein